MYITSNIYEMYDILKEEFSKIGCKNKKTVALATQVYLELCEVKRYWDINYFYDKSLENIYFAAKISKNEEASFFVPIEVSQKISFNYLKNLFKLSVKQENKIFIVIVDSDSTCVYYQIHNGLMPPFEESKISTLEESRKIDANLRKHRSVIEQAALYGIPVSLPKLKKKNDATTSKSPE